MTIVPPYSALTTPMDPQTTVVEVSEMRLHALLRALLERVRVDESWYLARYADVDAAVRSRAYPSGKIHYIAVGYFEDRLPRHIAVDEVWYLRTNPDVAEAVGHGDLVGAQEHFEIAGFREGRLPAEGWFL